MHRVSIKVNFTETVRRELFDDRWHTVVPAVIVVEGVLNGALLTADELAKFPEAWNGRPVPIFHPTENGEPISANAPNVLERIAGHVFNTHLDGDKLKCEFWLDEQRMDRLGTAPLLASMIEGELIEVSTGYFCDSLDSPGEFNGIPYQFRHINLRPDHVALLPGQVGACSVADGCGAPRVNSRSDAMKTVITEAMDTLRTALGLKTNCTCEGATMKPNEISTLAAKLATNGADLGGIKALAKLKTNFDIAELTKMDEAGRTALAAALKALDKAQAKQAAEDPEKDPLETEADPEADPIDNEDEDKDRPANNRRAARGAVAMGDLATMIRKVVRNEVGAMRKDLLTAGRRADVTARLLANQRNAFDEAELQTMSVDQLDKYERSIRDADYSGAAGGFVAHSGDDSPLVPPAGLLAPRKAN